MIIADMPLGVGWFNSFTIDQNGSDPADGAIKLARAYTGREMIGIYGSHPFLRQAPGLLVSLLSTVQFTLSKKLTTKFYKMIQPMPKRYLVAPRTKSRVFVQEAEKIDPPADSFPDQLRDLCSQMGQYLEIEKYLQCSVFSRFGESITNYPASH